MSTYYGSAIFVIPKPKRGFHPTNEDLCHWSLVRRKGWGTRPLYIMGWKNK